MKMPGTSIYFTAQCYILAPNRGVGSAGGKVLSKALLKPITKKGAALSLGIEKTVFPANSPIRVVATEASIGAASSITEKLTNFFQDQSNVFKPLQPTPVKPKPAATQSTPKKR